MAKTPDASAAEKKRLADEKKKLKEEQKKQKKEAKKRAKEIEAQEAELSADDESGGFFTVIATIGIILVWVAILCVVIKLDVGGFGSKVLTPLLKDVPVVNLILPNSPDSGNISTDNGGYTNLNDATEQIKNLELQLQQAQTDNLKLQEDVANLKAENARLQEFEDKQVEFQRIKNEFYEEVVYAENGPGAEAYQKYYESMDPTTAEYLYKQVIAQLQEDKSVQDYASAYSSMKPKKAAAIFEQMTDNLNLAARILKTMSAENRGNILGEMDPAIAAKLTKIMDPES
jgi:flagellar motility protein MotE (MotC chaperone)